MAGRSVEIIRPDGQAANNILSPGIRVGDLIDGGARRRDPDSGETPTDIAGQTRNTLRNLERVLQAGGSSLANVVKVNIYLADISDRRP